MENLTHMQNSLVREHFTVEGTPKVKRSRENAEDYAAEHDLEAYRCTFCDHFHVGTKE
jgi:hypothetical protein